MDKKSFNFHNNEIYIIAFNARNKKGETQNEFRLLQLNVILFP